MTNYVSIIDGMTNATTSDIMYALNIMLDGTSGVANSSDYAVTESSPVGMSVLVGSGASTSAPHRAALYISSAKTYYATLTDAQTTLSIASNSSGSTRVDIVCIKFDTAASPDTDATNVVSLVVVQGTPGAGVPSTPANHYKLAEVTVANGATSISNANITDRRTRIKLNTGMVASGSQTDSDITGGSSTSSATFADITGADVSVTTTSTSNILLIGTVQAYAGTAKYYGIQWHDGTSLIGVEMYAETKASNGRITITNQCIVPSVAAGTKTYTLRHRSLDGTTSITAETINVSAISIPA